MKKEFNAAELNDMELNQINGGCGIGPLLITQQAGKSLNEFKDKAINWLKNLFS